LRLRALGAKRQEFFQQLRPVKGRHKEGTMAILVGDGVAISGNLVHNADTDEYQVLLRAGEVYDFYLTADPGSADPISDAVLTLAGPSAGLPVQDDESADADNANILFAPTVTGAHTVTVQEFSLAGDGGDYGFTFVNRSVVADIADHTYATDATGGIGSGATITGVGTNTALNVGDVLHSDINVTTSRPGVEDIDVVAVFLVGNGVNGTGTTYTFDMRGESTSDGTLDDASLALRDADGGFLAFDGGGLNAQIAGFDPDSAGGTGWYFLHARSDNFGGGTYELQVTPSAGTFDVPGNASSPFNAPLGNTVDGALNGGGDLDWYGTNLVAGFTYRFTLSLLTGAFVPRLVLHEAGGTVVASDPGTGIIELTIAAGAGGLHFLDVHDAGLVGSGTYALTAELLSSAEPAHSVTGLDGTVYGGSDLADSITGGVDSDEITGELADDTLAGGAGDDEIDGDDGDDVIDGGDGADDLAGGGGNDTVNGGDGDDTINGGNDPGQLNGGAGNDLFINVAFGGPTVSGGAGIDTVETGSTYALPPDVENLTINAGFVANGTGNALNNSMLGSTAANALTGLGGNDTIDGGLGNDTITGGAGKDVNTGSGGADRIDYNALSDSPFAFAQRDAVTTFAHGDKIDLSTIDANTTISGNQGFAFVPAFTHHAGQLQWDQVAATSWFVSADVNGDAVADFALNIYTPASFGQLQPWDFIL
jgi:hypothetical protein